MANNLYFVTIENKITGQTKLMTAATTEQEAINICEQWGWIYENGFESYWMGVTSSTDSVYEYLMQAFRLHRFETTEDCLDAIKTAHKNNLITLEQRAALLRAC